MVKHSQQQPVTLHSPVLLGLELSALGTINIPV